VRGGQASGDDGLGLHKYDFYSLSVGKLTITASLENFSQTISKYRAILSSNCFAFPLQA
jgi:hypothetical protein